MTSNIGGLTLDEERRYLMNVAEREVSVKRERLTIAARWASEHGRPCSFDSKGWPLDEGDWPLRPAPGAMGETMNAYRSATTRAKARRTRRANADASDITKLDLSGVRRPVVAQRPTPR